MTSFATRTPVKSSNAVVEHEELLGAFNTAKVTSAIKPRWQRKQEQQQQQKRSAAKMFSSDNAATPRSMKRARSSNTPSNSKSSSVMAKKTPCYDRFIPNRSATNMDVGHFKLNENEEDEASQRDSPNTKAHKQNLRENLLGEECSGGLHEPTRASRILAFKNKAAAAPADYQNKNRVLYSMNKERVMARKQKSSRHISSAPERILDAPDLQDDYYLNLLDWSAKNVLSVALGQTVYLWNAGDGSINELMSLENEEDYVSSVSWTPGDSTFLAVGTSDSRVGLWDVEQQKQLRSMDGHSARVGSLAWNRHILTSGGRDGLIIHHDVRVRNHKVAVLKHHTQEVCGLKWSPDGQTLASGGNDNLLCLWDAKQSGLSSGTGASVHQNDFVAPRLVMNEHCAAVKALAWCPWQRNLLASGGGTADRCIKFWNTNTGARLNSVDTGSQVCSLLWNPNDKEILSSHGFSQNQLCLWKYPTMTKIKELTGHTQRVLHLAAAPDGQTVCSGAADETLRFWKIFDPPSKSAAKSGGVNGISGYKGMHIR
jgi:cell division cycle 20, cofactor of APC complex